MSNLRLCGNYGHKTHSGAPCGYRLAGTDTACPHHSMDKTKQRVLLTKATAARQQAALPDTINTNDFATVDDCLRVRAQVVDLLRKDKVVDFRRLELILKATTGASADHATKATEKQNELLLAMSGHGAGVAMLQRLKEAPLRVLPGKRTTDKGPDPAGNA